ncbi:MAG TPA: oxidoreductase, partial [Cytophagales bacterium]|nr:oxidoreductase [Cytophagales bacterium]
MPSLFDPFSLGNLTLRNRIVVSPMQQYSSAKDGMATDWHLVHLGSRAVGGAGLVISEALPISLTGRGTASDLGIWSDDHIEGLSRITRFVKQQGAAMVAQLGHAAAKGSRNHP